MLKILVAFFLAWPAFAWASCVSRLEGSHPSLAYIIERAVGDGTLTPTEFRKFLVSPRWYNPFERSHETILRDRYRGLFADHDDGKEESRKTAKKSIGILNSTMEADRKIENAADEATASVLNPKWLQTISFPGDEKFRDGIPRSSLIWRGGRPVFYSPRATSEGISGLLYDPFAQREELRVQSFSIGKRLSELITPFSVDGHAFAAMFTQSTVLDLENLEDATARFEGNLWGLSKSSSVFANTKTNPILVQEKDAYRVSPPQPKPDSITLQSFPVESLKFGADDVDGGSVAWSVSQTSIDFHSFSKAYDPLLPIPLSKLGDRAEIKSLRLFSVREKLFAAILFTTPQLQQPGGWSIEVTHNRHMALVEVGGGNIVARKKLGTVDNELVSNFRIGKFHGKEKIYFAHRDREWKQHLYFVDLEDGDIKTEEIENFNGDLTSFKLRGNEILIWHDDKKITVLEHDTGQELFLDFACSRMAAHLEIFEFEGITYLFARPYARQGQLYQLTSASRTPQSILTAGSNACEKRLEGQRHPLVAILQSAVTNAVWTEAQFKKFALSDDWSNPFNKTSQELLTQRYQELYDQHLADMDDEQKLQARAQLRELATAHQANRVVSQKALEATHAVMAPEFIPLRDPGAQTIFAARLGWFENRPIILKPTGERKLAMFDPFNQDPSKQFASIPVYTESKNERPVYLTVNGKTVAVFPTAGYSVDLAAREVNVDLRDFGMSTPESRIVRTKNGLGLLRTRPKPDATFTDKIQIRDFKPGARWKTLPVEGELSNLIDISSFSDREIAVYNDREKVYFTDFSGREQFKPCDFNEVAGGSSPTIARLFKNQDGYFAVLSFFRSINAGDPPAYITVNLRTGTIVKKFSASVNQFDLIEIEGHQKMYTVNDHDRNLIQVTNVFTGETQDIHTNGIAHNGHVKNVKSALFRGRKILVWTGVEQISYYDFNTKSVVDMEMPGMITSHTLQTFTYADDLYVIVDPQLNGMPQLIRMTAKVPRP